MADHALTFKLDYSSGVALGVARDSSFGATHPLLKTAFGLSK